jgi:hypothetical protein
MRSFALAAVVALLTFSASGLSEFAVAESCSLVERGGCDERDCAPTCVTCGCCAQAVEPATLVQADGFEAPVPAPVIPSYRLLKSEPRDVLHVPKLRA